MGNFLDAGNNVMRQKVGKNPSAVGQPYVVARPTNNTADSRAATQGRPYFFSQLLIGQEPRGPGFLRGSVSRWPTGSSAFSLPGRRQPER